MAYVLHPAFRLTDQDAAIWRYQPVSRLRELLQTSLLYFARADLLGDPFEGSYSKATWERYRDLHPSNVTVRKRESDEWRRLAAVSCWHGNPDESAAMWSLYGDETHSIVIRSDIPRLIAAVAEAEESVYIGSISYIDYEVSSIPEDNTFHLLLHKRRHYAHESEIRAIVQIPRRLRGNDGDDLPNGIYVRVDPRHLIKSITVSPGAQESFRLEIATMVAEFGLGEVPVVRSRLDAQPEF